MPSYSPDNVIISVPEPLVAKGLCVKVVYLKARVVYMELRA